MQLAVLIPAYQCQHTLQRSLDALAQETAVFDVVIVDDGSQPPIQKQTNWPQQLNIVLLRLSENKGIEHALNHGLDYIAAHKYDFIARLDAGDLCVNQRLSKQLDYLQQHPACALVASYAEFYDFQQQRSVFIFRPPTTHKAIQRQMHVNSCFCHPATMFRVDAIRQIGHYSSDYHAAEDYDLFFRMVKQFKTAVLPEVLLVTEQTTQGISSLKRKQQLRMRLKIQCKNFAPLCSYSYWGICKTVILYAIPRTFVTHIKQLLFTKSK